MATTLTPAQMEEVKYSREYMGEYVRDSGFLNDMGKDPLSIIHVDSELTSGGKTKKFPLVTSLTGTGTYGNNQLQDNEEAMNLHEFVMDIEARMHAVTLRKRDEHFIYAKAREQARPLLQEWSTNELRLNIIDSLAQVGFKKTFWSPLRPGQPVAPPGGSAYVLNAQGSAAEMNAWMTNNYNRIQFGPTWSATPPASFTAGLATVATSTGRLTLAMAKKIRQRIKLIPHGTGMIKPIRSGAQGREYFKVYVGARAFADLKNDPSMITLNTDARPRDVEANPLFQDGDLIADGMIFKEIPEIPQMVGVGASSSNVEPVFFCGAQAVAVGWGSYPKFMRRSNRDYEFADGEGLVNGIGVYEMLGVNKFIRGANTIGQKDVGVFTAFVSSVD